MVITFMTLFTLILTSFGWMNEIISRIRRAFVNWDSPGLKRLRHLIKYSQESENLRRCRDGMPKSMQTR